MRKFIYSIVLLGILFASCNDYDSDIPNETTSIEKMKLYGEKYHQDKTKGVGLKNNLWENGQTIKIKFLNGTEAQHNQVKTFSAEWLEYANLAFDFVASNENADIKIAFDWMGEGVTWSYVGTDAKYIPQNLPSLNFGKLSKLDRLAQRDILMQFGHVLGLVNEHRSEGSPIIFDTEILYEYYLDEGWSIRDIADFFLIPFSDNVTIRGEYDSKSIMCWPIDEVVTINGMGQLRNSTLSQGDKDFIAGLYPKLVEKAVVTLYCASKNASIYVSILDDISIDWGDGNREEKKFTGTSSRYEHTYTDNQINHTIKIFGAENAIEILNITGSYTSDMDFSKNMSLSILSINNQNNEVNSLIFPETDSFGGLHIKNLKINHLDLTTQPQMLVISLENVETEDYIDFSKNVNLTALDIRGGKPIFPFDGSKTIDISHLTKLLNITFIGINLPSIDISNAPNIVSVTVSNNNISEFKCSTHPKLDVLYIDSNPMCYDMEEMAKLIDKLPDWSTDPRPGYGGNLTMTKGSFLTPELKNKCLAKYWVPFN